MIRVAVTGARGKMSHDVIRAVLREPDLVLTGAVSREPSATTLTLPNDQRIPWSSDLDRLLADHPAEVVVDFSNASSALPYARTAIRRRAAPVIGTSGLSPAQCDELRSLAAEHGIGGIIAPNFALGAVLMIHLSTLAAPFFEYVEITEMHHEQKVDAPSGTAVATARALARANRKGFRRPSPDREVVPGSRGAEIEGVTLHAVRMPGFVASQEVRFGALGQTLVVRHESISRESFMPGVIMAIRAVASGARFYDGLEALLGLSSGGEQR